MPKLKESCDCCSAAKVKCSRERPACVRCMTKGSLCRYSYSRRAGRRQASDSSISSASSIPSSPPSSSYTVSPVSSPIMKAIPAFLPRANSTSSARSDISDFAGLPTKLPPASDPPLPQFIPSPASGMGMRLWSQVDYFSPSEDLASWPHLMNPFATGSTSDPARAPGSQPSNNNFFAPASSSPRSSVPESPGSPADSIDLATPSMLLQEPLIQDNLLFSETEAVREELHLVANYLGTLEERVNKGVKFARLQERATLEAKAACEGLEGGDTRMGIAEGVLFRSAAENVAMQFGAVDLRKRLGRVRGEIEAIVGFG